MDDPQNKPLSPKERNIVWQFSIYVCIVKIQLPVSTVQKFPLPNYCKIFITYPFKERPIGLNKLKLVFLKRQYIISLTIKYTRWI